MSLRIYSGLTAIAGSAITLGAAYIFAALRHPWAFPTGGLGRLVMFVQGMIYIQYVWSIIRWITYRPVKTIEDDNILPNITVVVPAYNESRFIRHALRAILHSDYPKDKMSVIVVDDGSTDDTWSHILSMASAFKEAKVQYEPYHHSKNLGKRGAICTGLRHARGEILVSLDSDSILEIRSLRNIASPFLHDPRVGGVAGHLTAFNVEGATLPRLLDILYDTCGNIPRSAQSQSGGFVTILPGALSAYRTSAVQPLIEGLCNSRFLGHPLKHGEDIELTLGLLQGGWTTVYQSSAVIQTVAPESCRSAFLMYTRWGRSSYVYMLKGYSQMGMSRVLDSIRKQLLNSQRVAGSGIRAYLHGNISKPCPDDGSQKSADHEDWANLMGCLYMLFNLFCTAVGDPILFALSIYQIRLISLNLELLKIIIPVMVLLPSFQTALFFAEACREDEEMQGQICGTPKARNVADMNVGGEAESTMEKSRLYDRRSRLTWRVRYGGLAGVFHAVVISFSSLLALGTLQSQSWLTR